MTFSYYDAENDIIYENIQKIEFEVDMVKGDALDLFTVNHQTSAGIPDSYDLGAAYPNPFNPSTNIKYSIAEKGHTSILVYNLQGRFVAELVNDFRSEGHYEVVWNATNVSSGMYFIKMNVNGFTSNQKVMLIK